MLKSPTAVYSNEEFRCIANPLDAVRLWQRIRTAELRKKRHENALGTLRGQHSGFDKALKAKETHYHEVERSLTFHTIDDDARLQKLRNLLPRLIKNALFPMTGSRLALQHELLSLYATIDHVEMARDFYAAVDDGTDFVALVKDIERAEQEIKRADRDIAELHDEAWDLYSPEPPLLWADDKLPERFSNEAGRYVQAEMSDTDKHERRERNSVRILMTFVDHYKKRAPLFTPAVTVTGVAIDSLPREKRSQWQQAYDALKLGEVPKRPYFQAVTYQMSAAEKAAEAQAVEETSRSKGLFALVGLGK